MEGGDEFAGLDQYVVQSTAQTVDTNKSDVKPAGHPLLVFATSIAR